MTTDKYAHTVKRQYSLPDGTKITVTISQNTPINEADYMILRESAATEMAHCLMDLGNAMKPPRSGGSNAG